MEVWIVEAPDYSEVANTSKFWVVDSFDEALALIKTLRLWQAERSRAWML